MIFAIVFVLLITTGIGLPLTLWIVPKHNVAGRFGLSYLLGIGLFTLVMFIANLLGFKLTFFNNTLLLSLFSLPLIFSQKREIVSFCKEIRNSLENFHLSLLGKIITVVIGFLVISSFISTFYWPVNAWDALTLYDFRAKIFVQSGFIINSLEQAYTFNYPLLTSLSHTTVYLAGGRNPQFLYSLFYLSIGLIFYGLLREFLSRNLSLIFTLLLLVAPGVFGQSVASYTNLPYLAYFSLGTIYFFIWEERRPLGYLILSALLVGLSTWTRSAEPFWLVVFAFLTLIAIHRKRVLYIGLYSILFFPIQQAWKIFQSTIGTKVSTVEQISIAAGILTRFLDLSRWTKVLQFLYKSIIVSWGLIFILFLISFSFSLFFKKSKNLLILTFLIFGFLLILIGGTFVLSSSVGNWEEIPDSAIRGSMFFYPLFIYYIGIVVSEMNENK